MSESTTLGILNNIRQNASQEYIDRIPEATRENITSVGNALQKYTLLYNEFCDALFNKIGKTIIESKLFSNKLARFKSGTVMTGQDVEEIFVEMAKSEGAYDKTGPNPLGRRSPSEIKALYHRLNRQDVYAISIGDVDFIRAFQSESTLGEFIKRQIESVYSGASYDEWCAMKELIATYEGIATVKTTAFTGANGADAGKQFVKTLRKLAQDMTFASRSYNKAKVLTWTQPENLVLFVNKDIVAEVDVEVLAKAYNMGKTDIQIEIVTMDDFGTGASQPYAILADHEWVKVFDVLSHMETQRNAQGMFTNYFLHIHQILSLSDFKNAVAIYPEA